MAVALLALVGLGASAGTADAHTSVRGSTPANGTTVQSLDAVSVRFVDPVMNDFAGVAMTTDDKRPVPLSKPQVTSDTLTATVDGAQPEPGLYVVSYRAVAVDGHPITGSFTFTLDAPGGSSDPPSAAPPAPAPSPSPSPSPSPTAASPADPVATSSARPLAVTLGVSAALLALGALVWSFRRRAAR